jgi:hypothetical protein
VPTVQTTAPDSGDTGDSGSQLASRASYGMSLSPPNSIFLRRVRAAVKRALSERRSAVDHQEVW